jgi:predicted PurR-regulated permease PerM
LAMFSGLMAFVPTLGSILGSVPVILLGMVTVSPETGLYLLIMYLIVWQIISNFVAPSIEKRIVDIHPALLIVIIVMVSELGLFWVLLAAPVTAMIRDLFRYAYGRLSDPPRPAGLLPGETGPISTEASQLVGPARIPLVYRHGRDPRRNRRLSG